MPDAALSAAWKEACAVAPAGVVQLHTLEFRHPNFVDGAGAPTAIRVVMGHADLTAKLENTAPLNPGEYVRFVAFAFDLQLPNVEAVALPELQLGLDNVDPSIEHNLALATASPYQIECTYRCYLSTDLTAPQNNPPLTFNLKNIEADDVRVTAAAGTSDVGNRQFPSEDYTPDRFPGLIR